MNLDRVQDCLQRPPYLAQQAQAIEVFPGVRIRDLVSHRVQRTMNTMLRNQSCSDLAAVVLHGRGCPRACEESSSGSQYRARADLSPELRGHLMPSPPAMPVRTAPSGPLRWRHAGSATPSWVGYRPCRSLRPKDRETATSRSCPSGRSLRTYPGGEL